MVDMATVATLSMSKPFHNGTNRDLFPQFLHPVVCEGIRFNQTTTASVFGDEKIGSMNSVPQA
jgi:hypothetical protein